MAVSWTMMRAMENLWNQKFYDRSTITFPELRNFVDDLINNMDLYGRSPTDRTEFNKVFNGFVEYCMYRNIANYDSMILISSEKGMGKSSFAIMLAKRWCQMLGIRFDPERHIAYSNAQVAAKIDRLKPFEPIICDEAIRFASCVSGDSKIMMPRDMEKYPDGIPIKELEGKKDFYVYSFNAKKKKLELRKAKTCVKTKRDIVYEVKFSNGQKIKCTKEHKFLLMDGSLKEMRDLVYDIKYGRKRFMCDGKGVWQYPDRVRVFVPKTNGFIRVDYGKSEHRIPEHRFIASELYGDLGSNIVHHKDGNPFNNTIKNLEVVSKAEHNRIHPAYSGGSKYYDEKNSAIEERRKLLDNPRRSWRLCTKFSGDKSFYKQDWFKKKMVDNKKASFKLKGLEWKDVYKEASSSAGQKSRLVSMGSYVKSITELGIEDVYDIIEVDGNHNYVGNMLLLSNSEDWSKAENKELKKKLGQVRTKHLFYILCFPLKVRKLDKVYLESYVNYWIDLVGRGIGALYVKDKNPEYDSWRLKEFQKIGSYTEFTTISKIRDALKKHPNFWYTIKAPKPPAPLYEKYLKVREYNVYDDANVLDTLNKSDVVRALLLLTLKEILTRDSSMSIKRVLLHLENTYDITIPKKFFEEVMNDAIMLANKVRENNLGKYIK